MEKLFNLANRGNPLITLILFSVFTVIAILIAISLQFSESAYYYTLSSIFQGLFSILALAGIFVIFRIEQLSKDEAKYETDIKDYLEKIKNKTVPLQSLYEKEIMEWNEYDAILKFLGERKIEDYRKELEKFKIKLTDVEILEGKISEIKDKKVNKFTTVSISVERLPNYKKQVTDSLRYCDNWVKECEKKGFLIQNNMEIKSKLLELFKMPFMLGMILIAFTIFLLPMLNSNSEFWFQVPGNFVVGFLVSFTLMVIFKIMFLIYYSMWSDEAKSTLI